MSKRTWKNLELKMALVVLAVVALLSFSVYLVVHHQHHGLMIDKLKDDAVIVHRYAEDVIEADAFFALNTRADEESELYTTARGKLDEIRRIANILYLYTAKRNENGEYIYLVDGLNADSENFRHIGDPIEEDIIPLLQQCLNNEIVLGNEILNTEWGIVYVAYFPFHDADGRVIGAIGMEFDCENLYLSAGRIRQMTVFVSLAISLIFVVSTFFVIRRIVRHTEASFLRIQKELSETEEHAQLMLDSGPLCCQLWSKDFRVIDCNEAALALYGFVEKQDYIRRWLRECSPEHQADGLSSAEKGLAYVKKAFKEGRCVFDWMHQMPDGTLIPSEVTLVRVKYKDDYVVAGYTRDLRDVKMLEEKAQEIYYDPLTGIYNRRYFDENLELLIKSLSRSQNMLSLIMIDIDRFKQYNDTYGHDKGDECLKTVAEVLNNSINRIGDFVARYGGEEFVAVLPYTGENGARMIAEKLLENVRSRQIAHAASDIADYVTISIGVVTGKANHTQDGGSYLRRADEMLYASKQNGRNRYTFAELE